MVSLQRLPVVAFACGFVCWSLGWTLGCTAIAPGSQTPEPASQSAEERSEEVASSPAAERTFTILGINDVYRIEGVDGGEKGGLSRLATLRRGLEELGEDVLLLHAGDLLYPSLLSRRYDGAQMIDILNRLDGDEEAFDSRLFVTFGNHEFDKDDLDDAPRLDRVVDASQFTWIASNIRWANDDTGKPLIAAPHLITRSMVEVGGVTVGLFAVGTDIAHPAYVESFDDPIETARRVSAELRAAGAEVVVALTHLDMADDLNLVDTLRGEGPDLVLGGHDHNAQAGAVDRRWVLKADADLRTATLARVRVRDGERPEVDHRLVPIGGQSPVMDPEVEARVESWLDRFDREYCDEELGLAPGCLEMALGRTTTELIGEETSIRRFETSLGNWVADVMLEHFADQGAQVALINSGSLRLNQDLPAGTVITRRHIEELLAYPAPLRLIEIDGRTLKKALNRSVETWSGNGWWLQISGLAFRHDPTTESASSATLLNGSEGPLPLDDGEVVLVATQDYLINPARDQDGYTMFTLDQVVAEGPDLKELLIAKLAAAEPEGIAPVKEGRICNLEVGGPCLALEPQ